MRISVTTPSLNQAAYIAETITSVLTQEGDFEVEYFVMDGGSTDGSVDIIRSFAERLRRNEIKPRCRNITFDWVSRPDKGQSDAINQGLRRSTGDIAAYINSDDRYLSGAFAVIAEAFRAQPKADFIYGDGNIIDEGGVTRGLWLSRPYSQRVLTSYHFLWNDFTNYLMQQAVFWRRQVISTIGLFDEEFHYSMDLEYWLRAGAAGLNLRHIPVKLADFRMIEGTKSLSGPLAFWSDNLEIFRRYRRGSLVKFFAYYFYNFALCRELSLDDLESAGPAILERWNALASPERERVERDARRGLDHAYGLIALELQRQGRREEAEQAYRRLSQRRASRLDSIALAYLFKRALGDRGASAVSNISDRLIQKYRQRRFDYRYQ